MFVDFQASCPRPPLTKQFLIVLGAIVCRCWCRFLLICFRISFREPYQTDFSSRCGHDLDMCWAWFGYVLGMSVHVWGMIRPCFLTWFRPVLGMIRIVFWICVTMFWEWCGHVWACVWYVVDALVMCWHVVREFQADSLLRKSRTYFSIILPSCQMCSYCACALGLVLPCLLACSVFAGLFVVCSFCLWCSMFLSCLIARQGRLILWSPVLRRPQTMARKQKKR